MRTIRAIIWGALACAGSFISAAAPAFAQEAKAEAAKSSASEELKADPMAKDAPWRLAAQWDKVDEGYTADIHKFTTDPKFLTPIVSYLPEGGRVPSPKDVLGYIAGAEGKLTRPEDAIRYFEALAKASPRVELREMGRTEEGRTMHMVIVSDEANLRRLDRWKGYTADLADPRRTDEARAREIARRAKPIMHITAGLHSPETGPPEMVMELAYRLAVSDHPDIEAIRKNVIVLITPVTDVDGRARVIEWYDRYLKPYDNYLYSPSRTPPWWGKYTFHDNNRDGLQMTQMLTQNYVKAFFEWHPTYSLDLHESVPLLYLSTGTGPYNEQLDPTVVGEWQWIANYELTELTKQGLPGVWTWGFYDGWNPSYLLWVTNNHNSLGRFYETFGNMTALTMERDLSEATFAGKPVTSRQWYRHAPPEEKVRWSLRNNTNYMQSGVLASLTLTAREGERLLMNFWMKGRNSLERGKTKPPHAWVIPREQPAKDRLAYLINQLRKHGIEVHAAEEDFEVKEGKFKQGDFIVRTDQPYGDLVRILLTKQMFPKDAEQKPYDDVSWTFGLIYRVKTQPIEDKAILEFDKTGLLAEDARFPGRVRGDGHAYAAANDGANALAAARFMLAGHEVLAAEEEFKIDDKAFPPGSIIIRDEGTARVDLEAVAEKCMLEFHAMKAVPEIKTHSLDLPRLALYHNWVSTQDDGWLRYSLEQAGAPYEYIGDDEIKAGGLRAKHDVILMANQGGMSAKLLVHGRDPKFGPMPYTETPEFPSHGNLDSSDDITGGIGFKGMANLEEFLNEGGTLVLLGSAGLLATETGLLRNVGTLGAGQVNTPGSSVQAKVLRRDHPIAYGFDDAHSIFRVNGPVYTVPKQFEHWIVAQYGVKEDEKRKAEEKAAGKAGIEKEKENEHEKEEEKEKEKEKEKSGEFLLAGYVSGQSELERKGVVLDVPRSKGGRVVLYSFNPMHRHLNIGDQNYVFNAILNWNDFPEPAPKDHPGLAKD